MSIILLLWCITSAFMAGMLCVGGMTKSKEYYAGSIAGVLLAIFLGVCLVGHVATNPLG